MATDAQTLMTEAQCYLCAGASGYSMELMKLSLLRQILLAANPSAVTDPQTLITQAQCYECAGASPYMLQLMELALLAQIAGGGGGGTSTSVTCGTGAPVTAPSSGCGLYIQTDSTPPGILWSYYSGSWH